ncbi:DUF484 family protein [Candidatus Albibeggiatoa sp. nov. NOAA]|uniref:DUF484 family protein n=1 Tax=Candidatus Albibeggiatoa sp. nov. NOAA TaxID=3162724 RepID=UPI0032FB40B4|nr:DUF484 family protein [Thiotrichaceae bacterium]
MTIITEEDVESYLYQHPKFFNNHADLLAAMEIPHERGDAVSLVERQLSVLREENQRLQSQFGELVNIAKENEGLNQRIQGILLNLAQANSLEELFDNLYETLHAEFKTDAITVRLFEVSENHEREEFVEYDAQVFHLFESILSGSHTVCGQLEAAQKDYLFAEQDITSAVLIPLGAPKARGILAMGSQEISRFHSGMSTDLLKYMGELIGQLLQLWLRH